MADSKVSKRKTEPKESKKKPAKEVTSPRKKSTQSANRRSAHVPQLVEEENKKNRSVRASISSPSEILPSAGDNKPKNENDEEYLNWTKELSKKAQAKAEENEKRENEKRENEKRENEKRENEKRENEKMSTKKTNGNKSPRVKKEANKKSKEPKENETERVEKLPRKSELSESESEAQDNLLSILSSLERYKELAVPAFLPKLKELLKEPRFSNAFIHAEGFEKLSMLLINITDTDSLVLILSFLEETFRDYPGVFEHLFAKSAVMVTILIWLLVKKSTVLIVTAKVYLLLANLPSIARANNFPENEIHKLIFSALNLYHQKADERLRFQNLIRALQIKELKLAILKLINAVIEMYQSVEGRIGMRLEFISLGLEEALIKASEDSTPDIHEEISRYDNLRRKDKESYKQLHSNLISPDWVEGKDLQSLAHSLITRWASLPNQQSVVVATLCSLLHIPNDAVVGTAKWIFLNKVVSKVVEEVKEKLNLEGCDKINLQPVLLGTAVSEVIAKKDIEDLNLRLQQQTERIQSLEAQIRQFTENSSMDDNTELAILKKNFAETTAKLSETEKKLNTETEIANQLQKNFKDLQNKFEILEKQDQENLIHIKSLQQKLEEQEKILQSKQTMTSGEGTLATVASTIVEPTIPSPPNQLDYQSGIDLGKEEQRMNRAMSKFGNTQSSSWMRNPVTPAPTPRIDQEGPSQNGINNLQKVPSRVTSPRIGDVSSLPNTSGGEIPEWRKRQLEKERLAQEKAEREQQRKLEVLSTVTGSTSITMPGTVASPSTVSETSGGQPVINLFVHMSTPEAGTTEVDEEHLVKPGSELSLAEREEMRLARALNRPRGQRTSQVHT